MLDYQNLTQKQIEHAQRLEVQLQKEKAYHTRYTQEHKEQHKEYLKQQHEKQKLSDVPARKPGRPKLPKEEISKRRTIYHHNYILEHKREHKSRCSNYHTKNPNVSKNAGLRYRARLFKSEGAFTFEEFKSLCEKQDYTCTYCGKHKRVLVPDHITPLSRGGTNGLDNVAPACTSCNAGKRDKTGAEYIKWRRTIGLPIREASSN